MKKILKRHSIPHGIARVGAGAREGGHGKKIILLKKVNIRGDFLNPIPWEGQGGLFLPTRKTLITFL